MSGSLRGLSMNHSTMSEHGADNIMSEGQRKERRQAGGVDQEELGEQSPTLERTKKRRVYRRQNADGFIHYEYDATAKGIQRQRQAENEDEGEMRRREKGQHEKDLEDMTIERRNNEQEENLPHFAKASSPAGSVTSRVEALPKSPNQELPAMESSDPITPITSYESALSKQADPFRLFRPGGGFVHYKPCPSPKSRSRVVSKNTAPTIIRSSVAIPSQADSQTQSQKHNQNQASEQPETQQQPQDQSQPQPYSQPFSQPHSQSQSQTQSHSQFRPQLPPLSQTTTARTLAQCPQLAISEDEDNSDTRARYRPFLLHPSTEYNDWISQLELEAVINMMFQDATQARYRLKVLVLYGSLEQRSPTITTALEISRILHRLGCDVRLFNPCSLPVHTSAPQTHPAILELHDLALWSDGHIWVSPSMHGSLPSVFKNQLDSISLTTDRMHPTAGRTLAIISVSEYREGSRVNSRWGDEARDVSNEMRALGQFMRMWMITQPCFIGSDSFEELNSGLRLRAGQDRIGLVDCLEEFVKFSILMRGSFKSFGDRFSDRLMNKNGPVSR